MDTQTKYPVDPKIERWHQDFEQVKQVWAEWCQRNATRYDNASQAWAAFIKEYQQLSLMIDPTIW